MIRVRSLTLSNPGAFVTRGEVRRGEREGKERRGVGMSAMS